MANKRQKKILKIDGIQEIVNGVVRHGRIKVTHLGFFEVRKYKGKKQTHTEFASKDSVVPSHNRLVFKPLKEVKRAIQ